ncbi:unnamed protein product [Prorocentrum cordatum]|uniref:PH domain-containing protein n=1 Tax=Prorocentrum cordatum TaxID=2364126 RepID=A0ABN9WKY5_9DINO|nr:unnamed protein product [Polarella glacialis]
MTLGSRGSDSAAQAGDARPERGPEEPPPEPREGAAGPAGPARPSGGPPGRRRAKPVLITACGVVPCPVPREVQRVRLHRDPQKQEVEVRSRWPFSYASQGDDAYRVHVKQVMLVASLRMQCADLNVLSTDPVTGLQMKPEDVAHKSEELGKKEEAMVQGVSLVPMKDLRGRVGLGTAVQKTLQPLGHHEKFLCEKVSKNMHITKTRYFNISGGRMRLYSYNLRLAKARTVFELKDVQKCVVEWVDQQKNNARPPGLKDLHPFHKGFQVRVRVELRERPHGPLYLYAANSARALSWQRVILLAKYRGSMLAKGWSAMVCYARWARQVKASVHRVSRKLVLGNLSRGFTKLLLVRRQRANQELEKAKAQEHAVQFLHQVLKGSQGKSGRARPAKSIRHEMISRVQHGFREFRERRILERRYPLSTSGNSRLSQLVSGSTIPCAFVSLSSAAALGAVLGPWTWRKLGLEEAAAQAATPAARSAYSAVNVPLSELAVRISANFSTLSFQHVDSRASHAQLKGETGWANFVQLDQVSSVVLRSERVMSYASPGSRHGQLHPATCEGVWLTLHGPRVGWCLPRQAAPAGPPAAARSDGPAGGPDGGALGRLLAESRHGEVAWLSVTLRLVGAAVPPPEGPAGGPEAREGVAEERAADEDILAREGSSQEALELDEGAAARPAASAGRRVCMVAHVLGRRFECEVPAAGLSLAAPEQPVEFKAEVPFVGLEALGCFDDCPVAVDIAKTGPRRAPHRPRGPRAAGRPGRARARGGGRAGIDPRGRSGGGGAAVASQAARKQQGARPGAENSAAGAAGRRGGPPAAHGGCVRRPRGRRPRPGAPGGARGQAWPQHLAGAAGVRPHLCPVQLPSRFVVRPVRRSGRVRPERGCRARQRHLQQEVRGGDLAVL